MGKLASGLFLTLIMVGSSTGAMPARGAPFTIHRHTIAASTATRSATPPFMRTGDGADKTFSSHPAEIADRARRVRLPAIESLPPTGCDTRRRKLGYPLGHDITGNISDVVVP